MDFFTSVKLFSWDLVEWFTTFYDVVFMISGKIFCCKTSHNWILWDIFIIFSQLKFRNKLQFNQNLVYLIMKMSGNPTMLDFRKFSYKFLEAYFFRMGKKWLSISIGIEWSYREEWSARFFPIIGMECNHDNFSRLHAQF